MKTFEVAARRTEAEQNEQDPTDKVEFELKDADGKTRQFVATPPAPGALAVLMQGFGKRATLLDTTASIIDFVDAVLPAEDSNYLMRRLLDRKDPFEFEDMEEILEYIILEWSGRPTGSLSGSTS